MGKCFRCIIEGNTNSSQSAAITVLRGTALCAKHAIAEELDRQRETVTVSMAPPRKAR